MKPFTRIVEENENIKYFKVEAKVTFYVKADTEGEAGYLADTELQSISSDENFDTNYDIIIIEETKINQ